jgi:predicted TPR repeat methyltransferase
VAPIIKNSDLQIADLGCGTGLCGMLFKSNAKELIGVDISSKMVELAKTKQIYDELVVADLIEFLNTRKNFNLILAADVFGYLGDLEEVFKAANQALAAGGYFTFTIEKGDTNRYQLEKSARYVHSKVYIHELSAKYSFLLVKEDEVQLRFQRKEPVIGCLFILQKS